MRDNCPLKTGKPRGLEGYGKVRRRARGKHQSTVPERPDS